MEAVREREADSKPEGAEGALEAASRRAQADPIPFLDGLLSHQHCVFSLCLGYARDAAQAEEWAQEAYLKALKNASGLRDAAAAKVWLCRIAKHTCLDGLKKERHDREALSLANPRAFEDRSPETLALEREMTARVKRAVRRLPRKLRDAFVLREYAELSYGEVAEALGCRRGTVMSRLNRARRQLARIMTEQEDAPR
ncbi:MAG: sigma-70 family RNA polymerase sigma factor [Candidatus Aminicenantes bacterium]|nr:sigma-70 family RNA polymerase sigma factor [Candidatus Aminicenantes bacterium]